MLVVLSSSSLYAQYGLGSITGSVMDKSGAAVPKAKVEVTNLSTAVVTRAQTSSDGIYNLTALVPGEYKMTVTKEGFEVTAVNKVLVLADQVVSSDVKLNVGKATTTVSVTAKAPLLTATEQTQATTEETGLVKNLPYPERSALEATLLVAGVISDPTTPGGFDSENPDIYTEYVEPGSSLGVGGGMQGRSAVMIDGSDVTQTSYPRQGTSVSGDNVEEVTVVTGGVSAQYGNTMGGAISMTTKGGTNLLHGGVTYRHTDPIMDAWPLGGTLPASLHQNFFGGYLGGPVDIPKVYNGRDKTFFYLSYEPARLYNAISGLTNFPTAQDAQGCFYNTYSLINTTVLQQTPPSGVTNYQNALNAARISQLTYHAPLNSSGFPYGSGYYTSAAQYVPIGANPNSTVCGGNVDDVSSQLAQNKWASYISQNFPSPQNPGPDISYIYPNGFWNASGQNIAYARGVFNDDNRFSVRIDRVLTANDHMFARYTDIPLTSLRFLGIPATSPMNVSPNDQSWAKNFALNESHVFTPSLVNELRLMYMRNHQIRTQAGAAISQNWATQFGLINPTVGYGWPVASYGYSQAAGLASGLLLDVDYTYQIGDDLTWTHGKHSVKFGADFRHMGSNQIDLNGIYGGTYSFSTSQTNNGSGGSAYASMDLGWISSYSNTPVEVPAYYRWKYYAGYVQDDWKILPHVTLNLGLRYEVETPRAEKYDNQGTFIPNITGTLNGQPATGAYCFSGNCGLGHTLWPINYKGFEPRVGVAWQPTSLMTVRASYGLLRPPISGLGNAPNPDFNVAAQSVGGTTGGATPNAVVSTVNNLPGPLTSALTPLLGSRGPFFSVVGITIPFVEQKDIYPYAQQWSLTLQYQLSHNSMISVSYNGLMGQHLVSAAVAEALNQEPLGPIYQGVAQGENFGASKPNPYGITNYGSTSINTESYFTALEPYQNMYNQSLQELYNRGGESIYHALYINFTQRLRGGISLLGSFAWSKSMDDMGGDANVGNNIGTAYPGTFQTPYNLRAERAVSTTDVPAKFIMGYSWDVPMGANRLLSSHNKYIDAAIGHWTTAGIYNVEDAWPFPPVLGSAGYWTDIEQGTVATSGGTVLPPGIGLLPNIVPGVSCVNRNWKGAPFTYNDYINPNMFSVPGSLGNPAFGNSSRELTQCRGPRQTTWNANILRRFPLGKSEKRYFEVGLQAQNVLNHPVFELPGNSDHSLYSAFNTTSLTSTAVPAFTEQTSFGQFSPNLSERFSRQLSISGRLFF